MYIFQILHGGQNPCGVSYSKEKTSPFSRPSLQSFTYPSITSSRKLRFSLIHLFIYSPLFCSFKWGDQHPSDCTALILQRFICWFRNIADFKKKFKPIFCFKAFLLSYFQFWDKVFFALGILCLMNISPDLVPERSSWFVRTDSLYFDLTSRQRNTICFAKSFDLQRKMLSSIIITPTNDIIKLFTCKEMVIYLAPLGVIFLLTQKWYCACGTVILYSSLTLAKRISIGRKPNITA